ncbi:hypothetical protein QFZ79_002881 [Arthrobacter sp. V4I6]|uniref:hypothetical protein n=1 Tax=Arthrobacter sp. V4I6 TaxID=3042281 RepID=UPI0027802698|nr:hypothetical protein [Arthrobacter sp. V4I6]MDQ0854770.1 hypothetical protein [Arthrobacter sp. V4I6]
MDSTQLAAAVLGSAAVTSVLGVLANGLVKYFNGTSGRERTRNTGLKEQREDALRRERQATANADRSDARADVEAHNRRLTEEYASGLRRDLTELGVPAAALRPWPALKKPPPDQEQQ